MSLLQNARFLVATLSFALCGCFGFDEEPPPGEHQTTGASWTVLVYMVADNDLEPFALADLDEMAQVGGSFDFRFVVQADRSSEYTSDPIGNLPDWTSTKRIVVEDGAFTEVEDLGEVNMGDPNALADFIAWGVQNYPADRYALIFWDHGAAWPGFGGDGSTADHDLLSVAELKAGIAQGLQASGESRFALVGYDACLMATWEVALAMKPYAEYLLASEELEPGHGWDWRSFGVIRDDATLGPVELGRAIIDGFVAQAQAYDTAANVTLSLTDLYALADLEAGITALSQEGQNQLDTGAITLARTLDGSLAFNRTPDPAQSSHMVDIGDLAARLATTDGRFAAAKAQIDSGLQKAIVYNSTGPVTAAATGLSIYFPPHLGLYRADYDDLAEVATWRTFLKAYYGDGTQIAVPQFTNPGKVATMSVGGGILNASGDLAAGSASSIATAELLYGFRLPNSNDIAILGDVPAQYDGSVVQGSWDLSVLTLTQGSVTGFAYLSIQTSGSSNWAAVIPFEYTAPGRDPTYCIRQLIFDASNQLVQDTYYLVTDAGVGELAPVAGSSVSPLIQLLDANGEVSWALGGEPMNPAQEIQLGFNYVNSGVQAFGALVIKNSADQGDLVSSLATVP